MVSIENLKTLKYHTVSKKTFVLFIICSKCEKEDEKIFKEEESSEILKILGLKICNCFKNIVEESISQEFRLENIDETRNCFLEEIEQNELMSNNHEKVCTTLNCIEHFLILASTITGCISISAFTTLLSIPVGLTSSAIRLKICPITVGIKKYK